MSNVDFSATSNTVIFETLGLYRETVILTCDHARLVECQHIDTVILALYRIESLELQHSVAYTFDEACKMYYEKRYGHVAS